MASTSSTIPTINYDIKPWNEDLNQFAWKGVHTRGLIIAGSVSIWIMPNHPALLPFFDQDFEFIDSDYGKTFRAYYDAMNRPADAQNAMFQTMDWPSIALSTLDQHIESFSYESAHPIDETSLSFRYLKGRTLEMKKHFDRKIKVQKQPPTAQVKELLRDTLNNLTGNVYEEVTDEVVFWIIKDPQGLLKELQEVKQIVAQNKIVYHCYFFLFLFFLKKKFIITAND